MKQQKRKHTKDTMYDSNDSNKGVQIWRIAASNGSWVVSYGPFELPENSTVGNSVFYRLITTDS